MSSPNIPLQAAEHIATHAASASPQKLPLESRLLSAALHGISRACELLLSLDGELTPYKLHNATQEALRAQKLHRTVPHPWEPETLDYFVELSKEDANRRLLNVRPEGLQFLRTRRPSQAIIQASINAQAHHTAVVKCPVSGDIMAATPGSFTSEAAAINYAASLFSAARIQHKYKQLETIARTHLELPEVSDTMTKEEAYRLTAAANISHTSTGLLSKHTPEPTVCSTPYADGHRAIILQGNRLAYTSPQTFPSPQEATDHAKLIICACRTLHPKKAPSATPWTPTPIPPKRAQRMLQGLRPKTLRLLHLSSPHDFIIHAELNPSSGLYAAHVFTQEKKSVFKTADCHPSREAAKDYVHTLFSAAHAVDPGQL